MNHLDKFELEKEYEEIWDKIRYKKVKKLYSMTQEVISILNNHINDKLLFHEDCTKIDYILKQMKQNNYFYTSSSAKNIITLTNPKFADIYRYKKCKRKLKYIGDSNKYFTHGKIYKSSKFNGATYIIKFKKKEKVIGYTFFERLS
jgi:hypothetical protein